jgi:glutamate dehydrogenase/leucine dehydrogenase
MYQAFDRVLAVSKAKRVDMGTAAHILAVSRIVEAAKARGGEVNFGPPHKK